MKSVPKMYVENVESGGFSEPGTPEVSTSGTWIKLLNILGPTALQDYMLSPNLMQGKQHQNH